MDAGSYHPVTMTINGVTKSVLVPLPKAQPQGKLQVTAKLRDGTAVVINRSVAEKTPAVVAAGNSNVTVSAAATAGSSVLLSQPGAADKRPVVTVKPVVRRQAGASTVASGCTVLVVKPRLGVVPAAPPVRTPRAVAVQYPSGQRRVIQISPPAVDTAIPPVEVGPRVVALAASVADQTRTPRPIILRRNMAPISRSPLPIVVTPALTSSSLTVIGSPRTLSRTEAMAVGWETDAPGTRAMDQVEGNVPATLPPHDDDDSAAVGVVDRNIVPMNSDDVPADSETDSTSELRSHEHMDVVVDKEVPMKVIEIVPDDTASVDEEDSMDVKPVLLPLPTDEPGLSTAELNYDDDSGRRCSSVSTDTAVSDTDMTPSSAPQSDFVVLAEWSHDADDVVQPAAAGSAAGSPSPSGRKRRRRRNNKWFFYRSRRPAVHAPTNKARRSGGRPMTSQQRYGIVDCFVSLPIWRLQRHMVDIRNWWRYVCCPKNQIQPCKCGTVSSSKTWTSSEAVTAATEPVFDSSAAGLIQPSIFAAGSATLPVQMSGPTSDDGVTPLLVRRPDGKLASVVARRTSPSGSANGANKKKYLLIKAQTGSYLVPVKSNADVETPSDPVSCEHTSAASSPQKCSSPEDVKPPTVSDTSGHRERIQQLKERLKQQEQQLNSIRNQLNCSAVQKFDFDSVVNTD